MMGMFTTPFPFIRHIIIFIYSRAAYCSDDCQNIDLTSPSISSASSTRSSPHLPYAVGGDVPALVPSALGSALRNCHGRDHYSISSSSASSTSWSVVTDDDDDDDDDDVGVGSEHSFQDGADSIYDGSVKSASFLHSIRSSAMSYARRPSGTNNRSTVPLLHRRTSSGSSPGHVGGVPRSAPIQSHASAEEDEADTSDFGFSSRDDLVHDQNDHQPENDCETEKHKSTLTKAKRKRNRASLPSYFSLLQVGGSSTDHRSSPKSSSSIHTVSRPSPPTPKLTLTAIAGFSIPNSSIAPPLVASIQATPPRGRRREPGTSRGSRRSRNSKSRSRSWSRSRSRHVVARPPDVEFELDLEPVPLVSMDRKNSVEHVVDWPPMTRGRATLRRNSSPPPKMRLSIVALDDHNRANATLRKSVSGSATDTRKTRGRAQVQDLDGVGSPVEAPGFGVGRSGLLDRRERATGSRGDAGLR
jgi:hypothetical protein